MANPTAAIPSGTFVRIGRDQVSLLSERGRELIEDLSRWAERILSDEQFRAEWGVADDAEWGALKANRDLVAAVRRRKAVRAATGLSTKEAARRFYNEAPEILKNIMLDGAAPGKTRIEAARELRQQAGFVDAEPGAAGEGFSLSIIIGDGVEHHIEMKPGPQNLRQSGPILDVDRTDDLVPEVGPARHIDWSALGPDGSTETARPRDIVALSALQDEEHEDADDG